MSELLSDLWSKRIVYSILKTNLPGKEIDLISFFSKMCNLSAHATCISLRCFGGRCYCWRGQYSRCRQWPARERPWSGCRLGTHPRGPRRRSSSRRRGGNPPRPRRWPLASDAVVAAIRARPEDPRRSTDGKERRPRWDFGGAPTSTANTSTMT